jgi:hypothetical protein
VHSNLLILALSAALIAVSPGCNKGSNKDTAGTFDEIDSLVSAQDAVERELEQKKKLLEELYKAKNILVQKISLVNYVKDNATDSSYLYGSINNDIVILTDHIESYQSDLDSLNAAHERLQQQVSARVRTD